MLPGRFILESMVDIVMAGGGAVGGVWRLFYVFEAVLLEEKEQEMESGDWPVHGRIRVRGHPFALRISDLFL